MGLEGEAVVLTRGGEPAPRPVEPEDEEEGEGPAKAAAEAVTARLSTIFQEPGEEPSLEAPEVRPQPHPERIPDEPHPQADFAAPHETPEPAEAPFALQPPEFDEAEEAEAAAERELEDEALRGPDLFEAPAEPPEAREVEAPEPEEPEAEEAEEAEAEFEEAEFEEAEFEEPEPKEPEPEARAPEPEFAFPLDDDDRPPIPERRIIDDASPYDFDGPVVQPMPEQPEGGALTVVMLAALGLVFFGGGAFWAFYARPAAEQAWLDPRMVGLLAGIAGALFISIAVYLVLQRLGLAAEREARNR